MTISEDILRELEKQFLECIDKNIISNDHSYKIVIFLVSDTMPNVVIDIKEKTRILAFTDSVHKLNAKALHLKDKKFPACSHVLSFISLINGKWNYSAMAKRDKFY